MVCLFHEAKVGLLSLDHLCKNLVDIGIRIISQELMTCLHRYLYVPLKARFTHYRVANGSDRQGDMQLPLPLALENLGST